MLECECTDTCTTESWFPWGILGGYYLGVGRIFINVIVFVYRYIILKLFTVNIFYDGNFSILLQGVIKKKCGIKKKKQFPGTSPLLMFKITFLQNSRN